KKQDPEQLFVRVNQISRRKRGVRLCLTRSTNRKNVLTGRRSKSCCPPMLRGRTRTVTSGETISTPSTLVRVLALSKNTLPPRRGTSILKRGLVARRERIPPEKLVLRISNDSISLITLKRSLAYFCPVPNTKPIKRNQNLAFWEEPIYLDELSVVLSNRHPQMKSVS